VRGSVAEVEPQQKRGRNHGRAIGLQARQEPVARHESGLKRPRRNGEIRAAHGAQQHGFPVAGQRQIQDDFGALPAQQRAPRQRREVGREARHEAIEQPVPGAIERAGRGGEIEGIGGAGHHDAPGRVHGHVPQGFIGTAAEVRGAQQPTAVGAELAHDQVLGPAVVGRAETARRGGKARAVGACYQHQVVGARHGQSEHVVAAGAAQL
jgi:hypothetical protein